MEAFKEKLRDNIVSSLTEIMENMAFMEIVPVASDAEFDLESVEERWVTLLVHDPVQGEFSLLMSQKALELVAESIYGLSDLGLSEQLLDDTLAEIINTVVGHFLNKVLPEDETYQLGLPELGSGSCSPVIESDLICDFSIEGEALRLIASGEALLNLGA